jgi:hypothetical protein
VFGEPLASNGLPLCSLLRERAFSEQLASGGLPLWLHYSGFQVSCHINLISFSHLVLPHSFSTGIEHILCRMLCKVNVFIVKLLITLYL